MLADDRSGHHDEAAGNVARLLANAAKLLGDGPVVRGALEGPLQRHAMLARGLPGTALKGLMTKLIVLREQRELGKAFGMSARTIHRAQSQETKVLSAHQSAHVWQFAELLAKATDVFGSQREAEEWLRRPATALDQHCPLELLATPQGARLVEELLDRLEFGVYT